MTCKSLTRFTCALWCTTRVLCVKLVPIQISEGPPFSKDDLEAFDRNLSLGVRQPKRRKTMPLPGKIVWSR